MSRIYDFDGAESLRGLCERHNVPISTIALRYEMEANGMTSDQVFQRMRAVLFAMSEGIRRGLREEMRSETGLVGGDANRLDRWLRCHGDGDMLMSPIALRAMSFAMATNESNACSGCIAACPTAGSAGIVPASLYAVRERFALDEDALLAGLLNAAAVGMIIESKAMMSGAEGGCQSEDGSAAAMAASAITEMRGGSPAQCLHAAALSLKNVLGLVCDPIGGLVEVPCIKRTAFMVMNAFTASDLAVAGVASQVPFDEVVDAMRRIGEALPSDLRETSRNGLATTATGLRVRWEMAERKAARAEAVPAVVQGGRG